MDEKLLNKIISVAYGDAGFIDKIKIRFLSVQNEEIKKQLEEHKKTANKIKNLKEEKIPEELLQNVKSITGVNPERKSFLSFSNSFSYGKPVIAALILGVIVFILSLIYYFPKTGTKEKFTLREIKTADKEIKHSLAFVANVFDKTKNTLEKDILEKKVVQPVHKGINTVNKLFKGENKNEKIN